MRLTAEQTRACAWYVVKNRLRPELSAHPTYRFTDDAGTLRELPLEEIMILYRAHLQEEKQNKKQNRKAGKA